MTGKRYFTQWAAQFFIAAELTRRGYLIALTLGNAPRTDIIVTSPSGHSFRVECKGMRSKGAWLFKAKKGIKLWFVFCYIPKSGYPDYYILSNEEASEKLEDYKRHHPNQASLDKWPGCNWKDIANEDYKEKWDKLPP